MASDAGAAGDRRRRLVGLAIIALVALGSVSCAPEPGDSFIGLIVLDAARPDRFSAYGYGTRTTPEIDRLGNRGTVFLNHFSPETHTRASLPTMLFSRYYIPPLFPSNSKVPLDRPQNLFLRPDSAAASLPRLLSRSGYYTVLFSAHSWMTPKTRIAKEFDEVYDLSTLIDVPAALGYPDAGLVVDYLLEWLATEGKRHRSLFVYLHLMDTHFPHQLGADARRLLEERGFAPDEVEPAWRRFQRRQGSYYHPDEPIPEREKTFVDSLYDGSLRFADRELGRLFRYLEEDGEYGPTLLAVTADHGEQLGEVPGRFGHGGLWYDLEARVPLIVAGDGVPAGRFEHFSEHVDLNPTLLALAGLPAPEGVEFDGVDLFAVARGDAPPKQYIIGSDAIRDARYKAIFRHSARLLDGGTADGPGTVRGQLFDLAVDPLEEHDVWSSEPAVAERMIGAFRSRMRRRYRRYLATHANEPPEAAFAIGALHFRLSEEEDGSPAPDAEDLRVLDAGWPDFHLSLKPGGTADVGFQIPDGVYRVSVGFAGEGTVRLGGGGAEVALSGPPLSQGRRVRDMEKETVDLGEIRIVDTRFAARARGAGSEGLLIRYFGFDPLGSSARGRSQEEIEAEERLRSLGYVD